MVLYIFNSYSATYGPISIKLCMLVNDVMSHMLTNFCEVLSFYLWFIGIWVYFDTPLSLNDPVLETQRSKFNFFSIIIDLESPENRPRLVWLRSGEKPGTSSQKWVLDKNRNNKFFFAPNGNPRYTSCPSWARDYSGVKTLKLSQTALELWAI